MKSKSLTNEEKKKQSARHGWSVVAICFIVVFYTNGVVQYAFTAFVEPIAKEFGWTYAQVSLAASIRGFEMGILAPVAGFMIGRTGYRRLILAGTCIIGLGLVLMSGVRTLPSFYGCCILISMGMGITIGVVPMTAISEWFQKRVSTATGIMVSGTAIGGIIVPLATLLIEQYGWRTAMLTLGLGMWLVPVPLSLLLRRRPQYYGCLPDGEIVNDCSGAERSAGSTGQARIPQVLLRNVMKRATFWLITLAFTTNLLIIAAVLTHVMPYLGSIGMNRRIASLFASALPLLTIVGRLGFGWLGDKYNRRILTACAFALNCIAIFIFSNVAAHHWLIFLFILLFGIGHGGIVIMTPSLVGAYYSREMFGSVLGCVMGIMTLGIIAGPPFAGWVFDTSGSYQYAWNALSGLALAGLLIVLAIPRQRIVR